MILALGDSFTVGEGLADWDFNSGPSKLAWPHLLASELNCEVDVCAESGASNPHILDMFLKNYDPGKHKVVIVLWSFLARLYYPDLGSGTLVSSNVNARKHLRVLETYFRYLHDDHVAAIQLRSYIALIDQVASQSIVLHDFVDSTVSQCIGNVNTKFVDSTEPCSFTTLWRKLGSMPGSRGNHYSEETHRIWVQDQVLPALVRNGCSGVR